MELNFERKSRTYVKIKDFWLVWGFTTTFFLTKQMIMFKRAHYTDKEISSGRLKKDQKNFKSEK